MKRIYRSSTDKMLGGVAAGMAQYLDLDVSLVRLLWIMTLFLGGVGLPAYIIAWIVIPEEPYPGALSAGAAVKSVETTEAAGPGTAGEEGEGGNTEEISPGKTENGSWEGETQGKKDMESLPPGESDAEGRRKKVLGIILIIFGFAFLLRETVNIDFFRYFWPLLLVFLGIYIIVSDKRGS
ncbi:MAG: PspC domain-containing protein [Bacillota bacterium]|jgi:phage shock protein C